MKYFVSVCVFLLVSTKISADTLGGNLFKTRSISKDAFRQLNEQSLSSYTDLWGEKRLQKLVPRLENDFIAIHRRSGEGRRGRSQTPPRDRSEAPRVPAPESPPRPLPGPQVAIMGTGPAKITTTIDGHTRSFPAISAGHPFRADLDGRRQAGATVKTMENTRTGIKGVVAIMPTAYQAAKVDVVTQEGFGRIERVNPPPKSSRIVAPLKEDGEEITADPVRQKLELTGSMSGRGTVSANAKNPDRGNH